LLLGLPDFEILFPGTVGEASAMLAEHGGGAKLLAGGSDLLIAMKHKKKLPRILINIKRIPGLKKIHTEADGTLVIGALATSAEIAAAPDVPGVSAALARAAEVLGTTQIRNIGTIGGNLGNASPSAEFAPPLLCLDAVVACVGPDGERLISLDKFFLGPGRSALGPAEVITEIRVPPRPAAAADTYIKHSLRRMDVAMASAAILLAMDGGRAGTARIALGAVAPTPFRAQKAEAVLSGHPVTEQMIAEAAEAATDESTPIDDIRGYAGYRRDVVRDLVAAGLRQVLAIAAGENEKASA
jgi:carbon-monoxide dehydrogenase medium subunit